MQQIFIEIATAVGKTNSGEYEYEGNTKEENNGYVVFEWNSQRSAGNWEIEWCGGGGKTLLCPSVSHALSPEPEFVNV